MSRLRVFIAPFDAAGAYADFQEVTDFVYKSGLGSITKSIESTEYDAGVFKNSTFKITLDNKSGLFNDVDSIRSMFQFKRSDSKIKITWSPNIFENVPGTMRPPELAVEGSEDLVVFEGTINDEGTTTDVKQQKISFNCMGYEYLFERMTVPIGSINAGDKFSEIILALLNQSPFSDVVTVTASNITPGVDVATDAVSYLENKTVKEALDDILIVSSSILYISSNTVFVVDRTPSATVQHNFYGQASNAGIENIISIKKIRNGINRMFNLWTWADTTLSSTLTDTADKYGIRKKEITSESVTNNTNRQTILDALKDEFGPLKRELELEAPVDYQKYSLDILDRVDIDYPTVFFAAEGAIIPIYGVAVYGADRYPFGEWSLELDTDTNWKIIGVKFNLTRDTIGFKLREI